MTLHQKIVQVLLFLNTFMISVIFRQREFGTTDVDFQIILKLGVSIIGFGYALYHVRNWIGRFYKIDGVFLGVYLLWVTITCFYSPSPIYSITAAFTFISVILLLYLAASCLSIQQIILPVIAACTLISFISIVVYYVNPDFGRMKEWVGKNHVPGSRLSGITGTANIIGYVSAFACLAIICYRLYLSPYLPKSMYLFFTINLAAQIMSDSRTSLLAIFVALGAAFIMKLTPYRLALISGGICFCILLLTFIDADLVFAALSRSGDASEITTGTGRTFIWAQALDFISQRPLWGWGFGSSGYIMPLFEHSSPHAHNMVLQILFTTGLIGLLLITPVFIVKIYYSIKQHDQLKMAFLVFLLIQGITESSAFLGVAGMPTFVLAMILALPYLWTYTSGHKD